MAVQNDDAEMLYRRVVHLLLHGSRTATYKLATMTALVDFSTDHLPAVGTGPLRVPISDLATRVIGLYWSQVREFEGKFLKQSTGMHSRIIEAVVQIQAAAASGDTLLPVDVVALHEPKAFRRAVDLVAITLAQQPLPRLQRMAGAAKSVPFLYDDSFLRDNVSRSELQKHDNSIILKAGVAQGLKEARLPLHRTLQSMWVDDILRMNGLPADSRADVAHHMFGSDQALAPKAPSTHSPEYGVRRSDDPTRIIRDLPTPSPSATFAERLDLLLEAIPPDHAASYSIPKIAAKLQARGLKINASDLASPRLGFQDNASHRLKNALADIFKIDPAYWSGKGARVSYDTTRHGDATEDFSGAHIELDPADPEEDDEAPTAVDVHDRAPFESGGRHRAKSDIQYDVETLHMQDAQRSPMSTDISHFARRLNDLFEHHVAPDGHTYTNDEVASELQADSLPITEGLIARLRAGIGTFPTPQQMHALTYFFDIDEDFFTAGSHSYQVQKVVADGGGATVATTSSPGQSGSTNEPSTALPTTVAELAATVVALSTDVCAQLEKVPVDIEGARSLLLSINMIGSELAKSTGPDQLPNLDLSPDHGLIHSSAATIGTSSKSGSGIEQPASQRFDVWTPKDAGELEPPGRWTLRTFVDAVEHPRDLFFLNTLLVCFSAQTEILGEHSPFWYGERPRGGIFFYPFRLRYPPFQLLIDGGGRLMVRGNWRNFPKVAGHPGFAELAEMLGQHQSDPSSSVPVEGLDAEELWDVAVVTARAINN